MEIKAHVDMSQVIDYFRGIPDKARAVSSKILTSAAFDVNAEIKTAMQQRFKGGATPYALRSFRVIKSTPETLESRVELRQDSPGKGNEYNKALGHLFIGGTRAWKKMEGAFLKTHYLPPGYAMVPGAAAPLDAFGNVPASFIRQLLSYLGAAEINLGYRANMTDKRKAKLANVGRTEGGYKTINGAVYFISRGKGNWFGARSWKEGRSQHLPMGIWKKSGIHGVKVQPVFLFVKQGTYSKVIDLEQILASYQETKFMPMVGRHLKSILEAKS
jgi:hypothetical protein